jgi:hypothetical protein
MKQVYSDIKYQKQIHSAGLWYLQITPREWLAKDPVVDFETGRVLEALQVINDKFFLSLELTPPSYDYKSIPKATKSGNIYNISLSGLLNTFNYSLQQVLESIKYSELVVVLTDRNKRRKVIGDTQSGMELSITHTHKNAPRGEEQIQLDFTYTSNNQPPYYNPDNTPETTGNFLIDSNGNYLLVE